MKISRFALLGAALAVACAFAMLDAGSASASLHNASIMADVALASLMVSPAALRARGIAGPVRADADPTKIVADLNKAFDAFKAENDKRLSDLEKGREDVVTNEKVERINASVGDLQKAIDELNAKTAALTVGGTAGDENAPSAESKEHRKAFNQFFRKGVEADLRSLEVKASLNTSSDPDGGYVVPFEMEQAIDRVLGVTSVMRSLATVRPISAATYKKLVNQGGAQSGWVGEKDARGETGTPRLSELEFPTMELYAMPAATQTLLDDSRVNIESWLADEVNIEFAEQEGDAFINGDGQKKPKGILAYDKVANGSYAWGKVGFVASGVAAALSDSTHNGTDALIDLIHSLKRGYRQNGRFLMNDLTLATIRKLKDEQGAYLWQPSVQQGVPGTLLGYGVEDDDNMPDIATNSFPIAFADFKRAYTIVDRIGVRVLRDPFTAKPYVLFYTTKRVGGGMSNFEAIKLLKIAA